MPRRKGGLFLPLDVNFMRDPRIVRARKQHRDAPWLYLAMCLTAKALGTDGRLEPIEVELLHVPAWKRLMPILLTEQLVLDLDDGFYTLAAWLKHNDPIHVVEARRADDAARKRSPRPNGIRTESERSRDVERSRVEKREVDAGDVPKQQPHGPCPGCATCPPLRVVV